jgi:septum formation protein
MELILGSTSPRRREILNFFSYPFKQVSPEFDETQVLFKGDPVEFVSEVALRKALCLKEQFPEGVILTADTTVYRDNKVYLKPETMEEALGMLKELAGKEHQVFTGVCVLSKNGCFVEAASSSVFFHDLTEAQIRNYHNHFLPLDKAGGYAIQKGGSLIVKRIEGCYYNIMGLPIDTVRRLLLKAGIDLWDYLKSI